MTNVQLNHNAQNPNWEIESFSHSLVIGNWGLGFETTQIPNCLHNLVSALSIVLPCSYPFKCIKPWINKYVRLKPSFLAIDGVIKISPLPAQAGDFLSNGKLKIFVGLFFPRYV